MAKDDVIARFWKGIDAHDWDLVGSTLADDFVRIGMRLTWPDLEMIKNTTAISRTFRSCVERLRKRPTTGRARTARRGGGDRS